MYVECADPASSFMRVSGRNRSRVKVCRGCADAQASGLWLSMASCPLSHFRATPGRVVGPEDGIEPGRMALKGNYYSNLRCTRSHLGSSRRDRPQSLDQLAAEGLGQ